jgi:hypothetical protein
MLFLIISPTPSSFCLRCLLLLIEIIVLDYRLSGNKVNQHYNILKNNNMIHIGRIMIYGTENAD